MTVVDLTREFSGERFPAEIRQEEIKLSSGLTEYTGVVYTITHDGMSGTYIDFPGHIAETDDGIRADQCAAADFYRIPARVIRLYRQSGSGAVTAADLQNACNDENLSCRTLIINALNDLDPKNIEHRSVYLDDSALQWIIDRGCKLLVSDIYESKALHGAFLKLFSAGISTVCSPVDLHKLPASEVLLTIMFPRLPVTQLPCRIVAEFQC